MGMSLQMPPFGAGSDCLGNMRNIAWCNREKDLLVGLSVWRLSSSVSIWPWGISAEPTPSWQTHIGLSASFLFCSMSRKSSPRGWLVFPRVILQLVYSVAAWSGMIRILRTSSAVGSRLLLGRNLI